MNLTFLFILSFVLLFSTGYFIAGILDKEKSAKGLIYIFISVFAQIIFTAEILSVFAPNLKPLPFLGCNIAYFIIALISWLMLGRPIWKVDFKPTLEKFKTCFKLDKSFYILLFGWIFLMLMSIFVCIFDSGSSGDGKIYHILRAVFWAQNNSINHFPTAEFRIAIFPINSEILYTWIYIFLHRTLFLGFFGLTGYIFSMISLYKIMEHFKICVRKRLWTLFILSSFACVLVQLCDTETDIIMAGLITSTMFLLLDSLKNKNKVSLFMSALCYAIAIGTKSTGGITVPALAVFTLYCIFKYKNYKYLLYYIIFGAINFTLFGAYNYVQNYLNYGNFVAVEGALATQTNVYGFKGFVANFIRHCYTFVDFTGFNISNEFKSYLDYGRDLILTVAQVSAIPERISSRPELFANNIVLTPFCGCGILGILILIPCWFLSLLQPIKYRKRIAKTMFLFGILLLINLISLSATIAFMQANIRFITTFIIISSPIIAMSYFRKRWNFIKLIFIFFAMFGFIFTSTHNIVKQPSVLIPQILKHPDKIRETREELYCHGYTRDKFGKHQRYSDPMCTLLNVKFKEWKISPKNKILVLSGGGETFIKPLLMNYRGWHFDTAVIHQNYDSINFEDYNFIIYPKIGQISNMFNENNDDQYNPEKVLKKTKTSEYSCFYIGNNSLNNPLSINCQLNKTFMKKHNYKIKVNICPYFILENKNKPIIKY